MSATPKESVFIRHATRVSMFVLTLMFMVVVSIFWHQVKTRDEAAQWVSHTYQVIGIIDSLNSKLKDAVLGERGYIITGDEDMLEPYDRAFQDMPQYDIGPKGMMQRRSVSQTFDILREKTADNPIQLGHVSELEEASTALMNHLKKTIEKRRAGKNITNEDLTRGKKLMDDIRSVIRVMKTEETDLLTLRLDHENVSASTAARATFLGLGITYVLLMTIVLIYLRNRERARTEASHYTAELEKREEELKQQQEELKASNEEIEASNEELEEKTNTLEEQNARIRKQTTELEAARALIQTKADELETASKYKSEFLANMSHELRTPLNSLLILARSFAANEEGNLTKEQIEEAQVIHNGGLELLNLINDILDLSKVEAGKLNITLEDTYLADITKRMSQQFEPVARERGVALNIRIEEGLPKSISTDAQRVEQILKNLLSNAFKFTEKGSVTLDVHYPAVGVELQRAAATGSRAIAFSVTDTGIGIDETKFRDIFEAFQQEDGSTERHYGGTGLGLTIARKFAHMLGGEIHVASTKGQGSTFTLFLPLAASATRTEGASVIQPQVQESTTTIFLPDDRKIIASSDPVALIIEDDRDFAATLMRIARHRGYKCLVAGDGRSGLLLANEYPVTAIILDLRLPDMDGTNVLDQLKSSLRTRHVPVHIISGIEQVKAAVPLRKGAVGYLTKPVTIDDINNAFDRMEDMNQAKVKKVLVVEDDKKTQTAIQSLLRQKNIDITIVDTGAEALARLEGNDYGCIILDLKLPDMTGFEWLASVEKRADDDELPPVIIYTARELSVDENRTLSRYTDSIVIKGASSSERLLDEVTLFLHSVESNLSDDQKAIIRMNHDPDRVLQNRTIMLVDDDMRNTFALSKILKRHGMNVVIADNGQMALDKLQTETAVELVIMDIMMPVMDGYQAMREIRANPVIRHLPVIALTARAMPEEQERCMQSGANDYMTKPVDVERLLTLLRVWLFRQEKAA